jgi:transitional endoplasmic reticulum ATPase
MQQIGKTTVLIGLDEDAINAEVLDSLGVTMEDFRFALGCLNPSLRETGAEIPTTTRNDIGGLEKVKRWQECRETITYPRSARRSSSNRACLHPRAPCFYAPPGTGKTLPQICARPTLLGKRRRPHRNIWRSGVRFKRSPRKERGSRRKH